MIVIYAEKASLAKAIAVALKAGNRISHPKEPTIGQYNFLIYRTSKGAASSAAPLSFTVD